MAAQCSAPIAGGQAAGVFGSLWIPYCQVYKGRLLAAGDEVQPSLDAEPAASRSLGAGYSCRVVDPVALGASDELYKSFRIISEDRKYFSGASGIKIADKEHPSS